MSIISNDIGIDIGTSTIRIYVKGRGLVIEEPAVAIIKQHKKRISLVQIGKEALSREHNLAEGEKFVRPLEYSCIKDNDVALQLLHSLVLYAVGSSRIIKPRLFVTYPSNISINDKLVLRNLCSEIGARQTFLISKPFASAIGVGIKAFDAKANMIIDAGAGTIDCAVVSLGDVVVAQSSTQSGDFINQKIIDYFGVQEAQRSGRVAYTLSPKDAEYIKLQIASALPRKNSAVVYVNTPQKNVVPISSEEIYAIVEKWFLDHVDATIRSIFSMLPIAMVPDIAENGIYLCGGATQLPGLDAFIKTKEGIHVKMVQEPTRAAINGLGSIITNYDEIMKHGRNSFLEVE